jgi:hypothetical protein
MVKSHLTISRLARFTSSGTNSKTKKAKFDSSIPNPSKKTSKSNPNPEHSKYPILDIESMHNQIRDILPKLDKMDIAAEITLLEANGRVKAQNTIEPLVRNLVAAAYKNINRINRKMFSSKIPQFIP